MEGLDVVTATEDSFYVPSPTGLAIYGDFIYWADRRKDFVATCLIGSDFTCQTTQVLAWDLINPNELAVFGPGKLSSK